MKVCDKCGAGLDMETVGSFTHLVFFKGGRETNVFDKTLSEEHFEVCLECHKTIRKVVSKFKRQILVAKDEKIEEV